MIQSILHRSAFVTSGSSISLRRVHSNLLRCSVAHRRRRSSTSTGYPVRASISAAGSGKAGRDTIAMSCDIVLDEFAFRQFDEDDSYAGTKIPVSKEEFMRHVEKYCNDHRANTGETSDQPLLVDGYAPFCKHIFMPNFDDRIVDPAVRISDDNESMIRTCYEARTDKELPVLIRYFPNGTVQPSVAKYLDLILYSREQIEKENKAMGRDPPVEDAPWRLISVKAQGVPYEIPMTPITIMRNELISQGGSGVPIDTQAYMKSVEYWKDHAVIR